MARKSVSEARDPNSTGGNVDAPFSDPSHRRRLFTVIAVSGGIALILGVVSIVDSIASPFELTRQIARNQNQNHNRNASDEQVAESLRGQDTDGDGLSDYDEIFTHRTSVFVQDSDSDGSDDAAELAAKTDPNCPSGKTCGVATTSSVDTVALREALKRSGVPGYVVDQTDDATLLQSYRETIVGSDGQAVTSESLEGLTATQVRSLLVANGLDETVLQSIDDQTILEVYRDALTIQPPQP